jgi:hypothetical protein
MEFRYKNPEMASVCACLFLSNFSQFKQDLSIEKSNIMTLSCFFLFQVSTLILMVRGIAILVGKRFTLN